MSSGQKAMAEEEEERTQAKRMKRLKAIPLSKIASTIDDIEKMLRYTISLDTPRTRDEWRRLDCIAEKLRVLL